MSEPERSQTRSIAPASEGSSGVIVVGDNGIPGGQVLRSMKSAEAASLSPPYSDLTNDRVKSSVYSAGVRNWMIVKGPPHVVKQPGRVSSVPVDLVDVFATIRDVALVPAPPTTVDGVSLKQVLKSPANEPAHPRAFHYSENFAPNGDPKDLTSGAVTAQAPPFSAARHEWDRAYAMPVGGTWFKLIRRFDNMGGEREELYELDDDPYEQVDLADAPEHAATRAALGAALDALLAS